MELMEIMGFCPGIENYSMHLDQRIPGQPPNTLIDYFPKDFLMIIDESHQTIPQIRGMYEGDRSRKQTLVDHGFRLPSALDNRPLNINEFEDKIKEKFGKIEVKLQEGISLSSPNKINEENKLKDIENSKIELSNDSEIKDFLDEFDGEIEVVTKIKN